MFNATFKDIAAKLYRGSQLICGGKPRTCRKSLTNFIIGINAFFPEFIDV